MSKSPAVLFYTSDFISGTAFMNFKQRGMYITLLCLQHQQGHLREEDMIELCGGRDEKVFQKFIRDENGLYYNERMEKEFQKRSNYLRAQSENGKLGGRPKKAVESPQKSHGFNLALASLKPRENENENIDISENLIVQSNNISTNLEEEPQRASNAPQEEGQAPSLAPLEERFLRFWEAYPRKRAKNDAKRRWMALKPSEELLGKILTAIEEQKKSEEWKKDKGAFIPYPATWLNRGQWEDELTKQEPEQASEPTMPKYGSYSADDAFEAALKRSYGG